MAKKQALEIAFPHPAGNTRLIGHKEAAEEVQESITRARIPHAWLITGAKGIGKATLAYRTVRYLIAGSREGAGNAAPLGIREDHPLIRRIAEGNFTDLMVLERKDKDISVEEVRQIAGFLRLTPAESPYRIVLIDSADDMTPQAANALLKLLEEPPAGSYLFLISHNPGSLLPTIRSRCRQLRLHPPVREEAEAVLSSVCPGITPEEMAEYLVLAEGSPGQAAIFYRDGLGAFYRELLALLEMFPSIPMRKVLEYAEKLAGKEADKDWRLFLLSVRRVFYAITTWFAAPTAEKQLLEGEKALAERLQGSIPLTRWLLVWEELSDLLQKADNASLDRKASVLSAFEILQQLKVR